MFKICKELSLVFLDIIDWLEILEVILFGYNVGVVLLSVLLKCGFILFGFYYEVDLLFICKLGLLEELFEVILILGKFLWFLLIIDWLLVLFFLKLL